MATSYTTIDKTVLNTSLKEEVYQKMFWSKFTGLAQFNGKTEKWMPSGSPIERFTGFKATGRTSEMQTMLRNVYGYGRVGKSALVSHEKDLTYLYFKMWIHLLRFGVKQLDQVDAEKMAWADMANAVSKTINRWWAGYLNHDLTRAYLEGYSKHITDAAADGGFAVTKRYPKNFWVWDGGENNFSTNSPTFSYTSSDYQDNIEAELANGGALQVAGTTDNFDVATLEALPPLISYSNLNPWIIDGEEAYILVLHSRQIQTLRSSSVWQGAVASAGARGMDNPIFKYAVAKWGKIWIFQDDVICRIAYASDSTTENLNFFDYSAGALTADSVGMYEKVQAVGTGQIAGCGLLLGQSSMAEGLFSDLKYTDESLDHGMIQSIGSSRYYGYTRMDYYDQELTTAPTDQQDPQMAVIVSYVS